MHKVFTGDYTLPHYCLGHTPPLLAPCFEVRPSAWLVTGYSEPACTAGGGTLAQDRKPGEKFEKPKPKDYSKMAREMGIKESVMHNTVGLMLLLPACFALRRALSLSLSLLLPLLRPLPLSLLLLLPLPMLQLLSLSVSACCTRSCCCCCGPRLVLMAG